MRKGKYYALAAYAAGVFHCAYSQATDYFFEADTTNEIRVVVNVEGDSELDIKHQKAIDNIVTETVKVLDRKRQESDLFQLNASLTGTVPSWLYHALMRCEHWFEETEGNISCRNGELYTYWHDYIKGKHSLSRREARRLARAARIAEVKFQEDNALTFTAPIQWELSEYAPAIAIDRVVNYLSASGFKEFGVSLKGNTFTTISRSYTYPDNHVNIGQKADDVGFQSVAQASIIPWQRTVIDDGITHSKEKGVLNQSDGWPSAKFHTQIIAPSAFDAALLAQYAVVMPAQSSLSHINQLAEEFSSYGLKLSDENGRAFTSDDFASLSGQSSAEQQKLVIDIALPLFNIADYRGPYISVWLTDHNNHLLKTLALRGTSERWIHELRTWWRRVGRKNIALIDGFAGATQKNKPLHIIWNGSDDFGEPVNEASVVLHIEVAREHGGRTYQKIPITVNELSVPILVGGEGEIGDIRITNKYPSR